MYGYQGEVHVGIQNAVWSPFAQEGLKDWEALARPSQLEPEKHRHEYADEAHKHSRNKELLRDHFVIGRENILRPEVVYRMLVVIVALCVSRIVCVCVVCHNEILYRVLLQRFSYGLLFRKPLSVLLFGLYHNVHLHVVVSRSAYLIA